MTSIGKEHPRYLDEPESRRLEFKERLPKGNQLVRTAVAFANRAGGKIVLGVKDSPREIIGIAEDKLFALEERINSSIFDQCAPTIVPEVYLQSTPADYHINNFTALSVVGELQCAFLPLALYQILKSGYYLTIYNSSNLGFKFKYN
ncbi:MAG: ATP-binding protein [Deltaproteobacteria bacterium]|nr:ATP-binding protein [Deltaproteobacteria bacterium]